MKEVPTSSSETAEIPASEAIRGFYQKHAWAKYDSVMRAVDTLESKDPAFLEKTWNSTKDLRETGDRLFDRARKRLQEFGIELVNDPNASETLGLSTPRGGQA